VNQHLGALEALAKNVDVVDHLPARSKSAGRSPKSSAATSDSASRFTFTTTVVGCIASCGTGRNVR
jgi:hypothetical protein